MKNLVITTAAILTLSALAGCKKGSVTPVDNNVINTTVVDEGKTITVATGQTVAVTLGNPGDGGYQFNTPVYDATVIRLDSHIHTPPADTKLVGNFGTDTFNFIPLKSGTTVLKVTASRGKVDTMAMFSAKILVQ